MNIINVESILNSIEGIVKSHYTGDGKYANRLWQNEDNSADTGYNAYGCADAANILYTLDCFEGALENRDMLVKALQGKQDKETGIFLDSTHHEFHTTAHCIAALELFNAKPMYPLHAMLPYTDFENFVKLHEENNWLTICKNCTIMHASPAIYAAFVLTDTVDSKWRDNYFDFLDKNCNEETGMWANNTDENYKPISQMVTAFHFLFNYEHGKRAFPYPDKLIDTCLEMRKNDKLGKNFGKTIQYHEVDWVYCLNRASRQTPHRFYEVKENIYNFAVGYIEFLKTIDWKKDDRANDLHLLFGAVCCLAELQNSLPGIIYSEKPLRLVLDRRPFI